MPRYLALEWDRNDARVVVVRASHRDVVIEQAFSARLAAAGTDPPPGEDQLGPALARILDDRRLTGLDALVAIGRSNVELRMLTLPPAPDDELPELVRFQAQTQFATLGGDWELDFLPLSGDDKMPRTVLAAGIAPTAITAITEDCHAARLKPRRMLLRACGAASLLRRQARFRTQRICLMIDLLEVEADLTVLLEGRVVFMRTVRLSDGGNPDEQARSLAGEILRTMAAAHNQLNGEPVEQIVLFGRDDDRQAVHAQIQQSVQLPVELLDPFGDVSVSPELASALPGPGGFAPLVGALLDEAQGVPHAIDFLHPRRKPAPPNRRRAVTIAAAIAATIVALIFGIVWWQLADQDQRIKTLGTQLRAISDLETSARQRLADVQQIDDWAQNDVLWLEELSQLSDEFPPAESALVTRFVGGGRGRSAGSIASGEMVLDGLVDDRETIAQMETALRDAGHRVFGTGGQYDDRQRDYPWKFKTRVEIVHGDENGDISADPAAAEPPTPAGGAS